MLTIAWMLTYLLHSTLLLGLAWLASKPLSRWSVAAEEAVWKLALVGAVFTASLQFATGWEPAAGRWHLAEPAVRPAAIGAAAPAVDRAVPTALAPASALEAEPIGPMIERSAPPRRSRPALPSAVTGSWLLGMLALLAVHGASYLRLRRRLRPRPRVIGGTLFSQLRGLAAEAGVGEEVRLTCSSRVPVPVALGLRKREICVPPRALAGLTDEQQEGMLAHELAHLERRDPFWLVVGQAISCVLFFQPLNWVARRRLREISEMLSDEWAVSRTGRPLSLAGCLAEVAAWSSAGSAGSARAARRPLPVPGMADRPSNLGRRIRRLLDETRSPEHPARRLWLGAAMVALVIAVAAAAPAVSTARPESPAVASPAEPAALAAASTPEPPKPEARVQEAEEPAEAEDAEEPEPEVDVDMDPAADAALDEAFGRDYEPNVEDIEEAVGQALASVDAALDSMDVDLEGLSDQDDRPLPPEEQEKLEREIERSTRRIEETLKPRMEQLSREMAEKMTRLQEKSGEMQRLQAEMERLAEQMRPSGEEMARLHAQIDEQVNKMRADGELSRQEREEIARQAREMAERMKPTEEQRQQMRQLAEQMRHQQREMSERFRAENVEEIQKAQREMQAEIQREMQAVREEVRRSIEQRRLQREEERRERRKEIRKEIHQERRQEEPKETKPPAGA